MLHPKKVTSTLFECFIKPALLQEALKNVTIRDGMTDADVFNKVIEFIIFERFFSLTEDEKKWVRFLVEYPLHCREHWSEWWDFDAYPVRPCHLETDLRILREKGEWRNEPTETDEEYLCWRESVLSEFGPCQY